MPCARPHAPALPLALAAALSLGAAAVPAGAQNGAPAVGDSGAAYLDAIRFRGVQARIDYLDPAEPLPDPAGQVAAPGAPPEEPRRIPVPDRGPMAVVALLALAGLGWFLWRASGGRLVRFARDADARAPGGPVDAAPAPDAPPPLATILAEPDRGAALVGLMRLTLDRAARETGVRLRADWTMREALARIPANWAGRRALADLARAAERARFGHYPVDEQTFARHLAAARPLLEDRA